MLCNNDEKGFTLLEVLVACGILSIGLASIMTIYASSINALSLAGKYEQAHFTAESLLAKMLFADNKVPFDMKGKSDQPAGTQWAASGRAGDLPGLKLLSVTVSFQHAGRMRDIVLESSQLSLEHEQKK